MMSVKQFLENNPEVDVMYFDYQTWEQLPYPFYSDGYNQCIIKRCVWCPADDTFRIFI